jgi:hypothetical protein
MWFTSTSCGILGLYNLWRRPFYGPEEYSNHYGMKKAKDSSRCPMFPWYYKLLSIFYPKSFKDCCTIDVPYLQKQAQMEFRSKPSLLRPQDCFYNGTNFNPSRFFKAILSWKWCIWLYTQSDFISKRRQQTTSSCGFSFTEVHNCKHLRFMIKNF